MMVKAGQFGWWWVGRESYGGNVRFATQEGKSHIIIMMDFRCDDSADPSLQHDSTFGVCLSHGVVGFLNFQSAIF